jgi:hypothetical protein
VRFLVGGQWDPVKIGEIPPGKGPANPEICPISWESLNMYLQNSSGIDTFLEESPREASQSINREVPGIDHGRNRDSQGSAAALYAIAASAECPAGSRSGAVMAGGDALFELHDLEAFLPILHGFR